MLTRCFDFIQPCALYNCPLCFQVILRSKRGVSYMGDVVVDDVEFNDCAPPVFSGLPCMQHEFACANGLCIPDVNLCDFIDHCGDGSDENRYICSKRLHFKSTISEM